MFVTHDFRCTACGYLWEDTVRKSEKSEVTCPECGGLTRIELSAPALDPKMGLDPGFPTAYDRWANTRRQRQKIDKQKSAD